MDMSESRERSSDSEKSSDDEVVNFKRRARKRLHHRSNDSRAGQLDETDGSSVNLSSGNVGVALLRSSSSNGTVTVNRPLVAVPEYEPSVKKCQSFPSSAHTTNGVKAIPCPVIMSSPSQKKAVKIESPTLTGANSSFPSQTNSLSSDPGPKLTEKDELRVSNGENGAKSIQVSGGITFRSSATKIMKEMGFERSKGLGITMNYHEIDPSSLEEMEKKLEAAGIKVDNEYHEEEIQLDENIHWITPIFPVHSTDYPTLSQWKKTGPQKTTIRGEIQFIDQKVLEDLLALKKCFNSLYPNEYMQLRARSNPYEKLGKGPFICRAALKMANLDAALSQALTNPTTNSTEKVSAVDSNELFYFADVCAGPGGFSEYVLSRKKWECKGFGMTLKKSSLDFDLYSSTVANAENFEAIYGPAGDGDVYNPVNTTAFINRIRNATDGRGVHLLMADGGFDVDDKELQEIASSRIYLAQCFLALTTVRTGGSFVCKLFDALTPFTVGLIYLMYISFDLITLHKPVTSRPANSERYLICKWKRLDTEGICTYLADCYHWFWERYKNRDLSASGNVEDIVELVPLNILEESGDFLYYIRESNTRIAKRQIDTLKKMVMFSRDPHLRDSRQDNIRAKLLEMWKIPQNTTKLSLKGPEHIFKDLSGSSSGDGDFLQCGEYPVTEHNAETYLRSPFDWRIVVVGGTEDGNRGFYMSLGRDKIYRYHNKAWARIPETLELTKETLVYGEFVEEIQGKKPTQSLVRSFHIIDAMILGGTDVRSWHYTARLEICIKFARAMNKSCNPNLCQVRAKTPVRMENIGDVFGRLENRVVTGYGSSSRLVCPVDHTDETLPFIQPTGIQFLKITKDPWSMAVSRSSNRKYYFNCQTGQSSYGLVLDSISDFKYTMQNRIIWRWNKELMSLLATQDVTDFDKVVETSQGVLNPQKLLQYINNTWQNRTAVMRRLSSSSSSQGSS